MASPATATAAMISLPSLFILCFLAALVPLCHSAGCHPADRAALIDINKQLNHAFGDDVWNPAVDCCQWSGVTCDNAGKRVVEFSLDHWAISEFNGPIPDAIGRLTDLRILILRLLSEMSGSIPSSLSGLKHLTYLTITGTNVSGSIPEWIGRFKNLTYLDLSYNRFSGRIPSSIGYLPKIASIELNSNQLSGPIPRSFGRFPGTIPSLKLSNNRLTRVPKSMGDVDFQEIWLHRNLLKGDVSHLFKNRNASLRYIDLSMNRLKFDLSRVVFPLKLEYVALSFNRIYGRIPPEIVELSILSTLDLRNNRL